MSKKQVPIEEGLFYIPDSPEKKPYLIGSKCSNCGFVVFPKVSVCANCGKKDVNEDINLDGAGVIDTFSVAYAALPGFKSPSTQAYINLKAGPRVWGLIADPEPGDPELEIGMEVELVIAKVKEDAEGNEVLSYQFKPLRTSSGGQL